MKTFLFILVGIISFQLSFSNISVAGETSAKALKENQRPTTKKQDKPAQNKLMKFEPRKLISDDSTKALKKWLEMEKDYKKIKMDVDKQTVRLEFFKERLDKAKKVAELYKEPGKDPDYLSDQKEAKDNEVQSSKNYDVEAKKLDNLKAELAVSEKRYNIAEKAYKIYNPSLSGFAGKSEAKAKKPAAPAQKTESDKKEQVED